MDLNQVESFLSVGCPMVFDSDPVNKEAPRYSTVLRGWREGNYVLLDRPRIGDRYAAIREGQRCVLRFLREGKACAFDSRVLDWDTRQINAYCRISWPTDVVAVSFRKHERVLVSAPCQIYSGQSEADGQLTDLSLGGCGVSTSSSATYEVDSKLELSFSLPTGVSFERIEVIVKNCRPTAVGVNLGCEFISGQPCVESDLGFFIAAQYGRDAGHGESSNILVIDDNDISSTVLKQLLEEKGHDVTTAAATLDGLARLRLVMPKAVLICQGQQDLPGLSTVQLIKRTPGLESIPLFLYGCDVELEAEAKAAGARYFSVKTPLLEVARTALTSIPA